MVKDLREECETYGVHPMETVEGIYPQPYQQLVTALMEAEQVMIQPGHRTSSEVVVDMLKNETSNGFKLAILHHFDIPLVVKMR